MTIDVEGFGAIFANVVAGIIFVTVAVVIGLILTTFVKAFDTIIVFAGILGPAVVVVVDSDSFS